MKGIFNVITLIVALTSVFAFAADEIWRAEFSDTMPAIRGLTNDYCNQHAPNIYSGTKDKINTEVKAQNGVNVKNTGLITKIMGGTYMFYGSTQLSGTYQSNSWQNTANFVALGLEQEGVRHGTWFTNECKGFYKLGPVKKM